MPPRDEPTVAVPEVRPQAQQIHGKGEYPALGANDTLSVEETLHELCVYQVDLETQNRELRQAQVALDAMRKLYFELYELAPVGYLTVSEAGEIQEANLTIGNLLGVLRGALVTRPISKLILRDDEGVWCECRRRLLETGEPQECDLRMLRVRGGPIWVRLTAVVGRGEDGPPLIRVALSDITERKRVETALGTSEQRYRTLFEGSRDALMTLTPPTWRFSSGNAAALSMFGARSEAELLSRTLADYSPGRQPEGDSAARAKELLEAAMREGTVSFEWTFRRSPGESFSASVVLTRLMVDGRPFIQACVRDETEKRSLQARLAVADRLSSVGMIAASVAHEINNPLAYVLYNIERLEEDLPRLVDASKRCASALRARLGEADFAEVAGDGAELLAPAELDDSVERIKQAVEGAHRIKEVSRGLGAFSRMETLEVTRVALAHVMHSALKLASNEIRYKARLLTDLGEVPPVRASEGKLAQVFLNLLVNAAHAIEEGDVEKNEIGVRIWAEHGDAFVEVRDTGNGIPPENLPHLFEPFFTTKAVGKGSGLGLTICQNIVTELGGEIHVESKLGEGTHVIIRLPIDSTVAQEEVAPVVFVSTEREPASVRGRILVVDDERAILSTLARALGKEHDVVVAGSGEEAQAIIERDGSINLILCDLMMPGMTGMDLHSWLVSREPALAANLIFMTGGVFTPRAAEYLEKLDNTRVEKPFDMAKLKWLVEKSIQAARASRTPVVS